MLASLRWLFAPALLAGLLAAGAQASGPAGGFPIKDGGDFFNEETVAKAQKVIAAIKKDYNKDLLIEMYKHPPDGTKDAYERQIKDDPKGGKEKFFQAWARDRYNKAGVAGVLILICREPTELYIEEGRTTEKRSFTPADGRKAKEILIGHFREKDFNGGLLAVVDFARDTFRDHGGAAKGTKASTTNSSTKTEGFSMSPAGWICIGLGALLAIWVVIGLFRAMTGGGRRGGYAQGGQPGNYGPGGPPPGYIPPPGYGGGGGGGGFMQGMLGGMLGGAAGMWAYDRFFRGDSGGGMTPPAYGGGTQNYGGGAAPDDSAGTGGTGGDWSGGTDAPAGGGGGDWGGGGGDAGGGGDWGGGGDAGGGGDWGGGGGGGGDWGGGGGDGGGGGGDW